MRSWCLINSGSSAKVELEGDYTGMRQQQHSFEHSGPRLNSARNPDSADDIVPNSNYRDAELRRPTKHAGTAAHDPKRRGGPPHQRRGRPS